MTDPPISNADTFRTMISDGHSAFPIGTIEYEGKLWLVPEWLVNDREGWRTPKRIICLSHLKVQDLRGKGHPADFAVNVPIPKSELDALFQGQPVAGWLVIEKPPIRFRYVVH